MGLFSLRLLKAFHYKLECKVHTSLSGWEWEGYPHTLCAGQHQAFCTPFFFSTHNMVNPCMLRIGKPRLIQFAPGHLAYKQHCQALEFSLNLSAQYNLQHFLTPAISCTSSFSHMSFLLFWTAPHALHASVSLHVLFPLPRLHLSHSLAWSCHLQRLGLVAHTGVPGWPVRYAVKSFATNNKVPGFITSLKSKWREFKVSPVLMCLAEWVTFQYAFVEWVPEVGVTADTLGRVCYPCHVSSLPCGQLCAAVLLLPESSTTKYWQIQH